MNRQISMPVGRIGTISYPKGEQEEDKEIRIGEVKFIKEVGLIKRIKDYENEIIYFEIGNNEEIGIKELAKIIREQYINAKKDMETINNNQYRTLRTIIDLNHTEIEKSPEQAIGIIADYLESAGAKMIVISDKYQPPMRTNPFYEERVPVITMKEIMNEEEKAKKTLEEKLTTVKEHYFNQAIKILLSATSPGEPYKELYE